MPRPAVSDRGWRFRRARNVCSPRMLWHGERRVSPCRQQPPDRAPSLCRLVPLENFGDDVVDLIGGSFRTHRPGDATGSVQFGMRNRADGSRLLTPWITFLLVNRDRVMRLRIDPIPDEEVHKLIPVRGVFRLDDIEMKH